MPEFMADPKVLSDAASAVAGDGRLIGEVAGALGSSMRDVGAALPGSRTASQAERLADALPAAARSLAAELALIAGALAAAAHDYAAADRSTAGDFSRAGRWPA